MSATLTTPHVPMRTCVACRTRRPQAELVRIVRGREGAPILDPSVARPAGAPTSAPVMPAGRSPSVAASCAAPCACLPTASASLMEVAHGA